jgi:hypothetical protein
LEYFGGVHEIKSKISIPQKIIGKPLMVDKALLSCGAFLSQKRWLIEFNLRYYYYVLNFTINDGLKRAD